jgi:hypothetical protein
MLIPAHAMRAIQTRERDVTTLLTQLEHHHVEQNKIKGRDESRSLTLKLIRQALSLFHPATGP